MNKLLLRGITLSSIGALLITLLLPSTPTFTSFAAAGDWKPDTTFGESDRGTLGFPHATGISRGTNAQVRPDNQGESAQELRINRAAIDSGSVFTCDMSNPNNHLDEVDNLHYFPDGLPYSSFNNYRNEFTNDPANPPLNFFGSNSTNSTLAGEVERNYLGGAVFNPTPQEINGLNGAKDLINITDTNLGTGEDLYVLAYVHNNGATALNPTTSDPRASLPGPDGNGTINLSTRAQNTRMHFSIPTRALPNGGDEADIVNRLRADNAYHLDLQNAANPCYGFNSTIGQQISDLTRIRNSSSVPLTFSVSSAYIRNPFITGESHANRQVDFSPSALAQLIDPALSQSDVGNQSNIATLTPTQGARISSGRSSDANRRDDARQRFDTTDGISCEEGGTNDNNTNCNAFAGPVWLNGEFDGEWYGSTEFTRYVGLNINAVEAEPELSVSKSVRLNSNSPTAFTTSGPTTASLTGAGNGQVEYMVTLQNTGNVDLDNVNFVDVLPPELAPVLWSSGNMVGQVSVCSTMTEALNTADACRTVSPHTASVPVADSRVVLSSSDLGISASNPLLRDPGFITSGSGSEGEVIRIRFFMSAVCAAEDDTQAINYAVASAESNGVDAAITLRTGFTARTGDLNVSGSEWTTFFPGHSLNTTTGSDPDTNETIVNLVTCPDDEEGEPEITIGKYVRQISPNASTEPVFGTSSVATTIAAENGTVEYAILIQNTGSGAVDSIYIADELPTQLAFVSNSIRLEYCANETHARRTANCTSSVALPDSHYDTSTRILALQTTQLEPLDENEFIRLRWSMTAVCTPAGETPETANNYALTYSLLSDNTIVNIAHFSNAYTQRPLNISDAEFTDLFGLEITGFETVSPIVTNNTTVDTQNCDTPPPGVEKSVSTTPRVATNDTVATTFEEARDVGSAVGFGERSTPYTAYYRVAVTNTSSDAILTNVRLRDRFYFRNGATVSVQNVVQSVGTALDTREVDVSTGLESNLSSPHRVVYTSRAAAPDNFLTFTIPQLLPDQTIAFYYNVVIDPGTRTASQNHRNEVQVCFDEDGHSDADECTGGEDRVYHSDIPRVGDLTLSIIKTVNGQDANNQSLTSLPANQRAVQVVNGQALNYQVVVTADAGNTAPVTNIILSDTISSLSAHVTNITNVRLITTGATCNTICTLTGGIADLSTRPFSLAAGQTATLTYSGIAVYTNGTTFAQNIARATSGNAETVQDPATIIVRNSNLTITKTVNGQDANTDGTAVTVDHGAPLAYVVTIHAPQNNATPVTGIVLTDTVTALPNVTNIRNIVLTTPGAPCAAPSPCALSTISDLSTRSFTLNANQTATLTYTATANNTTSTLSASNRNVARATPTTTNTNNPGYVEDPAVVFVNPQPRAPRTDFTIEKEANPTVVRHGDEVTYTITVEPRNSRNDEIEDLVLLITDDINDTGTLEQGGVTFTYIRGSTRIRTSDADCDGDMDDEDGIRCEDVTADDEIRITYRVRVSAPNLNPNDIVVVDNTARLRSDTPGVRIRDDDDAEVRVIADPSPDLPPPPEQFLNITKNVSQREVSRGQNVTYTIQVHNPNSQDVIRTLTDTIGLNGGTVPGQNGGRVRFNQGTLQITGAQFSGSISNPEGMVLIIPALGTATITYTAVGEPDPNQRVISLAPNTAMLNTGESATAFVELPKTGPAAMAVAGITALLAGGNYILSRRKKK